MIHIKVYYILCSFRIVAKRYFNYNCYCSLVALCSSLAAIYNLLSYNDCVCMCVCVCACVCVCVCVCKREREKHVAVWLLYDAVQYSIDVVITREHLVFNYLAWRYIFGVNFCS